MHALAITLLALAAPPSAVPTPAAATAEAPGPLGEVYFANSGAASAQVPFLRGLALLHNFEYERAAGAFREAEGADPGFAMAWWGEAMTFNHPVWMEQDKEAGEAVLLRLGATHQARLEKVKTGRERAYLEAVELLYGEGSKAERDLAYSNRMAKLFADYPDDLDARAFYALSLLGLAHNGRDHVLYMRAAALLEEVFPAHPRHPGVLHYLIHSYDDPVHAPLGLRAARLYEAVAPDAGHALHMTSHIFLALGLWPEVERANVQALAVVDRQRAARGRPPWRCGHGMEWLVYSRLEQEEDVAKQIEACRSDGLAELAGGAGATGETDPVRSDVRSWADMALRYGIESGHWDWPRPTLPDGHYLATRYALAYADLLAAGADAKTVRTARSRLEALQPKLIAAFARERPNDVDTPRWSRVVLMQALALEKLADGDTAGGVAALRSASDAEAAIPAGFGPPLIEKPSAELLGDVLLRLGRYDEAAKAYETSLAAAPNRRLSLRGILLARQRRAG
jgi:tetratricopeptide (TPR) repeat protein